MKILDACCGSKMFYFDKTNPNVTFLDIRRYSDILCDGRKLEVNPDVIGDFRNMQFSNDEFCRIDFIAGIYPHRSYSDGTCEDGAFEENRFFPIQMTNIKE